MSDLTDRLRRWAIATDAVPASDLMDEAADEIDRLRLTICRSRPRQRTPSSQRTAAITSGEELTMTEPNGTAEPSGASGGSGVCPYVIGTVTRYCTLTPFTLTDAEREALERTRIAFRDMDHNAMTMQQLEDYEALCGLLERLR